MDWGLGRLAGPTPHPTPREPLPGGLGGIWESASVTSARDSPRTTLYILYISVTLDTILKRKSRLTAPAVEQATTRPLGAPCSRSPAVRCRWACSTAGRCQRLRSHQVSASGHWRWIPGPASEAVVCNRLAPCLGNKLYHMGRLLTPAQGPTHVITRSGLAVTHQPLAFPTRSGIPH